MTMTVRLSLVGMIVIFAPGGALANEPVSEAVPGAPQIVAAQASPGPLPVPRTPRFDPKAYLQALQQTPRVACGMTLLPADPKIDPKIFSKNPTPTPSVPVLPMNRKVVPQLCIPQQQAFRSRLPQGPAK